MTNTLSKIFGVFASHAFPAWFQRIINRVYVRIFHIDLQDFAPADSYPTLNALFTRSLTAHREQDLTPNALISPSDSLITEQGIITGDKALQIKGMEYRASELIGSEMSLDSALESSVNASAESCAQDLPQSRLKSTESIEGFSYVNLYLSPSDYHRYHAPCDVEILEARYFGGELLPVNFPSLRKNANLFVRNERVVLLMRAVDSGRRLYFIAVGALNVGKMLFHFDPRIQTNATPNARQIYTYENPILCKKGEELGHFQMGSTIVLFMQDVALELACGQKVRFGQRIARFA